MPTLEELLYQTLTSDTALAGLLASHGGQPAVFEMMAPPDKDMGWTGAQTPRVEYVVSRQEDPERRVAGQVLVSILDESETMADVAKVEGRIRQLLDGAVMRPDDGTVSLHWARAVPFDQEPDYRGLEVTYDLIAWPAATTYDPDPVAALRDWTRQQWAALQVDPDTWAPTDAAPALYWRLAAVTDVERLVWGAWLTVQLRAHVLARSPGVRLEWVRRVTEGLALAREVTLADGSPLIITRVAADSSQDPYRTGQVTLTARFGVLLSAPADPILQNASIRGV